MKNSTDEGEEGLGEVDAGWAAPKMPPVKIYVYLHFRGLDHANVNNP